MLRLIHRPVVELGLLLFAVVVACPGNAVGDENSPAVYFEADVVPILTKLGCNSGVCHGKATGQNGFKLSLFGFEPTLDYESLVIQARGRRLSPAAPDRSLLLLKATASLPHGGGRRLEESSDDYRILRAWISQGTSPPRPDDPHLVRIELWPTEQVLETPQPLRVTALFSNGTSRDVTRQAIYQSNEPSIVAVDEHGRVSVGTQRGLASVMARFGDQIATSHAAVPFVNDLEKTAAIERQLDELESKIGKSFVDRQLVRQWRRLRVLPSELADDTMFLRRATIDICGSLPTTDETTAFLADKSPNKRAELVDRLLERPEYASNFAFRWADILQNRGSGYSTNKQRAGTTLFSAWIRDSFSANKPYDRFVSELLTASGSQNENPPTIWYRTLRKPAEFVESVAQAFLGVRIQCAQCHHHPTERWSQADYFGLAAVFARVGRKGGFADAEVPTDEIIYTKDAGQLVHPRTGSVLNPRPLGDAEFALSPYEDPRIGLSHWMTRPDNPYFARTMVNRMWAHFLGRGIIHPIDDARSTNPPSNPELLDALSQDFVSSGFDLKHLIRTITGSYAYQLDSTPNSGNLGDLQSFARFYPQRMTAEVMLDGLSQVLDVSTTFAGVPVGTRAIDLPDENVAAHFLDVFGRPARVSACECERVDSPSLTQALELVNSVEIQRKLTDPQGFASKIAASNRSAAEVAHECFLRTLARPPRSEELRAAVSFLDSESDRVEACRSLLWSLLATNEFMFNH